MARTDTLPHFLTDVADAIREKKGTSEPIQASNFDTEIESISGGGGGETTWYSNVYEFAGWQTPNLTSVTNAGDFAYSGSDVKALYQGHTINIVRLVPAQAGIITFRVYNDADDIVGRTDTASLRTNQTATATITQDMVNAGGYQEIELSDDLTIGANQFWSIQTSGDTGRFKFANINNWQISTGYKMYNQLGTTSAVTVYSTGALCVDVGYKQPGGLQEKTVTISNVGTTVVTPDEGYDGISKITIITELAYSDLDYLTASNGPYIDTNIQATNDIEVEIKFASSEYYNKPLFGTTAGADYYHVTLFNYAYYWGLNNGEGHGGSFSPDINTPHILTFNDSNSQVIVDGNVIGSCSGTTSSSNLHLLRRQNYYFNGRIYYVKVKNRNTDTLLLDLVPKTRISDSVIGFYDKLTGTFYTNNGSGNFTH